jgi:hypothetical protein
MQEDEKLSEIESAFQFCPACRSQLSIRNTFDIYIIGWQCQNHHHFHSEKRKVFTAQTGGKYNQLRSKKSECKEILMDWLSDPNLREHLNNDLAENVRLYLEKKEGVKFVDHTNYYPYCPICGEALSSKKEYEEHHVQACKNGHKFNYRSGLTTIGDRFNIMVDKDSLIYARDFKSWFSKDTFLEYVPNQFIETLQNEADFLNLVNEE